MIMNNDFNILNYIPRGKENAISRARLREVTGLNDSVMRQEIAKARREACIINLQDGRGYYLPTTIEEVDRFIAQEEHRAKSIFTNLSGARKYKKSLKGQMYFADVV